MVSRWLWIWDFLALALRMHGCCSLDATRPLEEVAGTGGWPGARAHTLARQWMTRTLRPSPTSPCRILRNTRSASGCHGGRRLLLQKQTAEEPPLKSTRTPKHVSSKITKSDSPSKYKPLFNNPKTTCTPKHVSSKISKSYSPSKNKLLWNHPQNYPYSKTRRLKSSKKLLSIQKLFKKTSKTSTIFISIPTVIR